MTYGSMTTTSNMGNPADSGRTVVSSTANYSLGSGSSRIVFDRPQVVINQRKVVPADNSMGHGELIELEPEEEAGFYQSVRAN